MDLSRNVEMDPESATQQVKLIEQKGQSLLGWYHSHPKFEVNPSHIDVLNHETYQCMFNEANQHFVGLIISPYYTV
jgi:protein MYSM1